MKISSLSIIAVISLVMALTLVGEKVFAQSLPEEVEMRGLDAQKVEEFSREVAAEIKRKKSAEGRLSKYIKVSYGYDSNPLLGANRSDDDYESFRLGIDYRRTFAERHQGALTFNVTQQNYNEITELSNTLGNFNLDYKYALTKQYIVGAGHNLSLAYYAENDDSKFMLNKSYVNFQQRFSAKFFHKIQYEFSLKHYEEAQALATSTTTYKSAQRRDIGDAVVYSIGYTASERFSSNISLRYVGNDSNSDYQDYYDYNSYDVTPRIYYKLSDSLTASLGYMQKWKKYKNRLVGAFDPEQIDRISRLDAGLNYVLNEKHSFSLDYTHNGNDSNNPLSDYTGSSIELGWRFNF